MNEQLVGIDEHFGFDQIFLACPSFNSELQFLFQGEK